MLRATRAAQGERPSAAQSGVRGEAGQEGIYTYLWPNFMLNVYPGAGNASTNLILPIDEHHCLAVYEFFFSESMPEEEQRAMVDFIDQVQREDIIIVESVQRGLRSGFYKQGQLILSRERDPALPEAGVLRSDRHALKRLFTRRGDQWFGGVLSHRASTTHTAPLGPGHNAYFVFFLDSAAMCFLNSSSGNARRLVVRTLPAAPALSKNVVRRDVIGHIEHQDAIVTSLGHVVRLDRAAQLLERLPGSLQPLGASLMLRMP